MIEEILNELTERGPNIKINAFDGVNTHSLHCPVEIVSSIEIVSNGVSIEIANTLIFSISLN